MFRMLMALLVSMFCFGCNQTAKQEIKYQCSDGTLVTQPADCVKNIQPSIAKTAEKPQPTFAQQVVSAPSLGVAVNLCHDLFASHYENEGEDGSDSTGAICLLTWATLHMKWADIAVKQDETKPGMVLKNPSKEIGKRICSSGTIIQIQEGAGISEGIFHSYSGPTYMFRNVGSSGSLVKHSPARLCGVVIGAYYYTGGMSTHQQAISIVGMFDLKENGAHGFNPQPESE